MTKQKILIIIRGDCEDAPELMGELRKQFEKIGWTTNGFGSAPPAILAEDRRAMCIDFTRDIKSSQVT